MSITTTPIVLSTYADDKLIALKSLDAVSAVGYDYEFSDYAAADKPGTIVIKDGDVVIKTLTLTYDGSGNVTSIVRS